MTSRALRLGCAVGVALGAVLIAAGAALLLLPAWRLPSDAPLARMYRTEADLTALVKAVDTYHAEYGVYPPAGSAGLRMATDFLSRKGHYLPDGPPPDGWNHPYIYVPSSEYAAPNSPAVKSGGAFCAPNTYQVYSLGADGDAGASDIQKQRDNITSWDATRPWRPRYTELNTQFTRERRKNTP